MTGARAGSGPTSARHGRLRIARLSDTHVVQAFGVERRRVRFNRRITGCADPVPDRGRARRRE